jgi:hypothetical protein
MKRDNAITVTKTGSTVTTGAATASVAIPTDSGGNIPNYVRVSATTESYVMPGTSTVVATANSLLVQPADAVILAVRGCTHIAYIQGTAAGKVNITPLEDF